MVCGLVGSSVKISVWHIAYYWAPCFRCWQACMFVSNTMKGEHHYRRGELSHLQLSV